tara:strand:- start:51636 stop:53306 length:1671 start_codon:yes stop_codon:yes gene_type:complete
MKNIIYLLLLFVLFSCSKDDPCIDSDLILYNTTVYTANQENTIAESVAIKDGSIIFVGSNELAEPYKCNAELMDLSDAYVYPGFIDSHVHLKATGYRELSLNLQGSKSLKEMLTRVKIYANNIEPSKWVIGRGWIEKKWPERRFPTKEELDSISSDKPILLERADGHAVIVNSYALSIANIDSTTKDPHGGKINRDENGNPDGVLVDKASLLVEKLIPKKSLKEDRQAIEAGLEINARLGWTQVHDAGSPLQDLEILKAVHKENKLPIRVHLYVENTQDGQNFLEDGPYLDDQYWITARGIKLVADGAIGSRGAAFFKKYEDYDTSGLLILKKEETFPKLELALQRGIQIQTHAIGDLANKMVLDWYEEAFKKVPKSARRITEPRWRIEHSQNITIEDQKRYKDLNVIASMQPSHAIGDLHFAYKRLGYQRLNNAYPWRSLLDLGVHIAGGSDAPVEIGDPRIEFKAAVSRKDLDGYFDKGWHLEQAVSREEALKMFTIWASYAVFEESVKGSIEVGKLADFTIFSKDIMTIPEEEIMSAEVLKTIVGGKIVYNSQ